MIIKYLAHVVGQLYAPQDLLKLAPNGHRERRSISQIVLPQVLEEGGDASARLGIDFVEFL
jgi:hypothetical protein